MTSPESTVMACLNSPYLNSDFLINAFKEHAPQFILEKKSFSSFEHMELNPEEGLKILFFKKLALAE
jgi:23S rRNA (cytosine1962-C5)-methyltransferase